MLTYCRGEQAGNPYPGKTFATGFFVFLNADRLPAYQRAINQMVPPQPIEVDLGHYSND
jgi:hypothetical protein